MKKIVISLFLILFLVLIFLWYLIMPFSPVGKSLVVANKTLESGEQIIVNQEFLGNTDLYDISLHVKFEKEDPKIYWYYLDHSSFYWRGNIQVNHGSSSVDIFNGSYKYASLNLKTKKLTIFAKNNRQIDEPQGLSQPDLKKLRTKPK